MYDVANDSCPDINLVIIRTDTNKDLELGGIIDCGT